MGHAAPNGALYFLYIYLFIFFVENRMRQSEKDMSTIGDNERYYSVILIFHCLFICFFLFMVKKVESERYGDGKRSRD